MKGFIGAGLAMVVLSAAAFGLAGTGRAAETVTLPARVEPATWTLLPPASQPFGEDAPPPKPLAKGHTLGIYVKGEYCAGSRIPEVGNVTLKELPKTKARPFKAAVITAYRVWPEQTYTPASTPSYENKCGLVPQNIFYAVKTKRPVKGMRLYDGYYKPKPQLVWVVDKR